MLTRDEVIDVLTVALAYDNRAVTEAAILAWGEAANRGRWGYQDALDCVHEHYARGTEYLMPGHITALLREVRSQPAPYRELESGLPRDTNPTGPPARPEHVAEVIGKLAAELGWAAEIDRRTALAVACPFCGELPGHPCTRPSKKTGTGTVELTRCHPSRIALAETTTEENPS